MDPPRVSNPRQGDISLRPARLGDGPLLAAILRDAVHRGAAQHYTKVERAAWCPPGSPPSARWETKLLAAHTHVACWKGDPVGFCTLGRDGYLDLLYVSPNWMGTGVATHLHDALLSTAKTENMALLSTEASYLALSFLSKHGWQRMARQSVIRRGVPLTNFRMQRLVG